MLSLSARVPESTGIRVSTEVLRTIGSHEKTPIPAWDRGLQEKARRFVGTLNLDVAPRTVKIASCWMLPGRRHRLGEVGGRCRGPDGPRRSAASRLGLASRFGHVGPRPVRGPRSSRSASPIHGSASSRERLRDRVDRDRGGLVFRHGVRRPCRASASPRRHDRHRVEIVDPGVHGGPRSRRHGSWSGRPVGPVVHHRDRPTSWRGGRAAPAAFEVTSGRVGRRFVEPARA